MSGAKRLPEIEAEFVDIGDQRRRDRRSSDRRTPRARMEPLFAATLISHVMGPDQRTTRAYAEAAPRSGGIVNLRA